MTLHSPLPARSGFWPALTIALFVVFLLSFVRLGFGSLWDNSEPQYGEIVKEMLRSGDWLTLHKDLQPWFVHPPLWFWTAASCAKIFGLNEFALRLPAAIFGVACAGAAAFAARRIGGDAAAVAAALALGTSLEFVVMSRLAIQDTMLAFFMAVATFWSYFAIVDAAAVADGDEARRRRMRLNFWIAVIAAALGTLVKGPVAIVLPLLTLLVWAVWRQNRRGFGLLPWLAGLVVYVVIAGAWFAYETAAFGPTFLESYFGLSNVARYLRPFENQPGPIYYYIPVIVIGFFPFIAFLPQAVARAWRKRNADGAFLLCTAIVPFVFFSLAQTKLPNYIALAFPACAIMVGVFLGDAIERRAVEGVRFGLVGLIIALLLLTTGVVVYGRQHFSGQLETLAPWLVALMVAMLFIAVATFVAALALRRLWIVPWGLAVMIAAFVGIIDFGILPQIERSSKPMKAMAQTVMAYWRPGERICFSGVRQGFSLDYYTNGPPVVSVGHNVDDVPPSKFFSSSVPALCVVDAASYAQLAHEGYRLQIVRQTRNLWLTHWK